MSRAVDCVMLVDDDADDNFFHERAIAKSGIADSIRIALDGQEALEYLDLAQNGINPPPSVILLDINMPRMNGYEFLDTYKNLPPETKAKVCIVMLTTSASLKDRALVEQYSDVCDYLLKPLTAATFTEMMERHGIV